MCLYRREVPENAEWKGLEATQGGEGGEEAQPADSQRIDAQEKEQIGHTAAIIGILLPFCQSH